VERADVRGVEQRNLFRPMRFIRRGAKFFLQLFRAIGRRISGGGGLGEGDHENFFERKRAAVPHTGNAGNGRLACAFCPVPAPAMTSMLPRAATACRWDGVSRSSFWVRAESIWQNFSHR